MGIFPEILPCIVIKEIKKETFEVSTMQGLDQGLGGKRYTAEYCLLEDKTKKKTIDIVCTVMGYACIHGIRCLGFKESLHVFGEVLHELTQYIVATDTHIKTIAAMEEQGGVQIFQTFKDDDFNKLWGIGVDHCGMKIHLKQEGIITSKTTNQLYVEEELPGTNDIVGRYLVRIGAKEFDTIRQIFIGEHGQITEFYFDKSGNEILKRHFKINSNPVDKNGSNEIVDDFELGESFYLNNKERVCESYVLHDYAL